MNDNDVVAVPRNVHMSMLGMEHREHVNEYILENPGSFIIKRVKCLSANNCSELRLTVDTQDDFAFAEEIIQDIIKTPTEIRTQEIIAWWQRKNPS